MNSGRDQFLVVAAVAVVAVVAADDALVVEDAYCSAAVECFVEAGEQSEAVAWEAVSRGTVTAGLSTTST